MADDKRPRKKQKRKGQKEGVLKFIEDEAEESDDNEDYDESGEELDPMLKTLHKGQYYTED